MSVQAMTWALAIPKADLPNPSARHVLLCLANYAGSDGRAAFPAAATLAEDTGLSERTVRQKLAELDEAGWISEGNQAIAAAYIDRRDRRPIVYDLQMKRGAALAPRERGAGNRTGCSKKQNGVQLTAERGAGAAPNTSLNRQGTEEQQQGGVDEEVLRQEQAAAGCPQPDRRFAMFATWEPDAELLQAQMTIAGLTQEIPDEARRKFKGFHVAKPGTVDSMGGWCYRLVTWAKAERVRAAGRSESAEVSSFDDDDTDWLTGGGQ